jgi:AcrR family transcriptional regulator
MFHYHFESKDAFLRALLQQLYEELFADLGAGVAGEGPALQRLERGLLALGGFVREHRALIGRLVGDAVAGHAVVHEFVRANAPRHLGLLMALLQQAEDEGAVAPQPPLQRVAFLLGSTLMPLLAVSGAAALGLPAAVAMGPQVTGDDALRRRIRRALAALRLPEEALA